MHRPSPKECGPEAADDDLLSAGRIWPHRRSPYLRLALPAAIDAGRSEDPLPLENQHQILTLIDGVGLKDIAETDWLEMFFYLSARRRDARELAEKAISTYGSLGKFMQRPGEELRRLLDVDLSTTAFLVLMKSCMKLLLAEEIPDRVALDSSVRIKDYLALDLRHAEQETLRVLYLDHKNKLIKDEEMARGTVNAVAIYPKEIARKAATYGASAVVIAHNHLSDDPTPTDADIEATARTRQALDVFDIVLHDHLIIAHNHCYSMHEQRLL